MALGAIGSQIASAYVSITAHLNPTAIRARLTALGTQIRSGLTSGMGNVRTLGSRLGTWFTTSFVQSFQNGIGGAWSQLMGSIPAELKLVGIAAGAILAAAIAPVLAAAIQGVFLAGGALAAVGVGVAFALKDETVQNALHDLKENVVNSLRTGTQAFAPALKGAFEILKGVWGEMSTDISQALAKAATYVKPLTEGIAGFIRNFMPGFLHAIEQAGPVVQQIKEGLAGMGKALGKLFQDAGDNANESAAGIKILFAAINGTIEATAWLVNDLADKFRVLTMVMKASGQFMEAMLGWIPGVGDAIRGWTDVWTDLDNIASGKTVQSFGAQIGGVANEMSEAEEDALRLRTANANLTNSFATAAAEAGTLKTALDELNGKALDSEKAELAYQKAIDGATESLKDNGRTVDVNTEKGRANREALLQLRDAIIDKVTATYEETLATQGQAAADAAAGAAAAAGRQQLIQTAMQLGMTKQQAIEYANRLLQIPGQVGTKVNINDIEASNRIQAIKDSLARIPGSKTINITVKADIPAGISMGYLMRANGGVIESYAAGGIRSGEKHDAQMARAGAWRMWAEPETGGESYIPHARAKRQRSIEVLRRTNEILGNPLMDPSDMAVRNIAGGGGSSGRSGGAGGGTVINNNYYVAMNPDMSKIKSLADVVRTIENVTSTSRQFRGASASVMA